MNFPACICGAYLGNKWGEKWAPVGSVQGPVTIAHSRVHVGPLNKCSPTWVSRTSEKCGPSGRGKRGSNSHGPIGSLRVSAQQHHHHGYHHIFTSWTSYVVRFHAASLISSLKKERIFLVKTKFFKFYNKIEAFVLKSELFLEKMTFFHKQSLWLKKLQILQNHNFLFVKPFPVL